MDYLLESELPPTQDERVPLQELLLTAEQVATALAICRTKVYELLRTGELEPVRIGGSRRIPVDAVSAFVGRLRGTEPHEASSDNRFSTPTVLIRTDRR
jgi:excisionase family DNA binding protein